MFLIFRVHIHIQYKTIKDLFIIHIKVSLVDIVEWKKNNNFYL